MGKNQSKAKSRVRNENENIVTNKSDIEILNQTSNETIVNTTVKNAQECSATIKQLQEVKIKNFKTGGDFNLGVDQKQSAAMTFSCVNASKVATDASTKMVDNIMQNLEKSASTDVMAQLEAAAKSEAKKGFASFGNVESQSDVENITRNVITNENRTNLKNVVANSVTNNFNSEDVKKCIAQIENDQNVEAENVDVGGNAIIAVSQDQSAELMAKCVNESGVSNKISSDLARAVGVVIKEDNKTTTDTKMKGSAESKATATGPIEELGDAVSGIIGSVGGLFGGQYIMSFAFCCCCVLVLGVVAFMMFKGGGAKKMAAAANVVDEFDDYDYGQYGGLLLNKLMNNNYAM
ncbi:MAG: hypothetical protein CMF62_03995 [Magnetococcales bacterium]|nr:hypothetical protein [Magnetococcales bacterium]|tara:strand:+ start:1421 stop:2470 length:1050 start_codon:yes stop_codon:yes gene_type:complete